MPVPSKINFTELNLPKDNFTEYPYERKPIFQIHIAASILPEWCIIQKVFTKKFSTRICKSKINIVGNSHIRLSLGALKSADENVIMVFLLSVSPLILQ